MTVAEDPMAVFAAAFRHAPIPILLVSLEQETAGRLVAANPAATELLGYSEAELLTMRREQLVLAEDAGLDAENWQGVLSGTRRAFSLERRMVGAGGRVHRVRLDVAAIEPERRVAVFYVQDLAAGEEARGRRDEATLTLGEAAHMLGVSASTVRRWADGGRLETVRTSGGHRRFPVAALRRVSGQGAPVLRTVAAPPGPVARLARLLASSHGELIDATVRALYEKPPGGWFAAAPARRSLEEWVASVEAAAREGDYPPAVEATRRLFLQAGHGGASPLERQLFLERFADVALRAVCAVTPQGPEAGDARRVFVHLRQAALAGAA